MLVHLLGVLLYNVSAHTGCSPLYVAYAYVPLANQPTHPLSCDASLLIVFTKNINYNENQACFERTWMGYTLADLIPMVCIGG